MSGNNINTPVFNGVVLLCEDSRMNQDIITNRLKKFGLEIVVAENGSTGVEAVKERIKNNQAPFNLIFMDILMPVMDGFEATAEVKKISPDATVIALTADDMSSEESRQKFEACGMSGYMGKPFTSKEILDCLTKYLKPANHAGSARPQNTQKKKNDEEFRINIIRQFINNNKNKHAEITESIGAGDIKLAHRLAHTLKSNAGQFDKVKLQEAAKEAESGLTGEINNIKPEMLDVLKTELEKVIDEFTSELAGTAETSKTPAVSADLKDKADLIRKLEILLDRGSIDCLQMTDDLRGLQDSGELIVYIKNLQFNKAKEILVELKKRWNLRHD